ncbi:MAG: phosphotransferase, partial [Muribaculaceae bacterium]|nr:phosphotransferase [Muribaculaceae bacterium]
VRGAIKKLVELQKTPEKYWVEDCLVRPFSRRQAMWDLNYFKYEYLRPQETVYDEEKLEDDFELLCDSLTSIPVQFQGFMMRDCQSRNVMITEEGPVFIDFQGGRKGPVLYDAVSMLWQARAGFDKKFRDSMLDFYCTEFTGGNVLQKKEMLSFLNDIVLFRTLQVLGAYGFRGLVQHKSHFLLSIPGALANLRELLIDGGIDSYPELKKCAVSLTSIYAPQDETCGKNLTVEIFSFSYKKGYPQDLSGNGGGFMFDCRAMHNPGRYAQYRDLTGRDQAVMDFLEDRGEIGNFLTNAWALIDPAIERYVARGFTRLQVGFGCTGGQHRSVYCAERTAAHVREVFPEVSVCLVHREHPEKKYNII